MPTLTLNQLAIPNAVPLNGLAFGRVELGNAPVVGCFVGSELCGGFVLGGFVLGGSVLGGGLLLRGLALRGLLLGLLLCVLILLVLLTGDASY